MSEMLDTIDAVVADWEAQPEAWNPGDPLHDHPYERESRGDTGVQHVRPMFQIIDAAAIAARCVPCQVTWAGIAACWVCGEDRPPAGGSMSDAYELMVRMTTVSEQMQRSLSEINERVTRQLDARISELIAAAPPPPPPRPVTIEDLVEVEARLRPLRPRVHMSGNVRVAFLPAVRDIHVPTVGELARAFGLGDVVLEFNLGRPTDLRPLGPLGISIGGRSPDVRPLAIDGHAYRRRTLARRRRNR